VLLDCVCCCMLLLLLQPPLVVVVSALAINISNTFQTFAFFRQRQTQRQRQRQTQGDRQQKRKFTRKYIGKNEEIKQKRNEKTTPQKYRKKPKQQKQTKKTNIMFIIKITTTNMKMNHAKQKGKCKWKFSFCLS